MQSFPAAVNGHVDVADQLSSYVRGRAADHFERERAEKRALDSPADFEARRERVREAFLDGIGGLPDRPTDLGAEITGRLEREGYAVETVVFESLPDFHVTANCYVPAGDGPHPGVLFLCGHAKPAKADEQNQKACIELARNGFVVLVVDPISQGEREQYRDPETGETFVEGGSGVWPHCYAGQKCFYVGESLARYELHDNRCALDYLCGRPEVDADRIAVTGTSAGGLQTGFLALVDDRPAATALSCSVTDRQDWLRSGKRIDAEQLVFDAIPAGTNYDDHVTALAPRPVFVGAAAWDQYFPVEGVHDAVERARSVYDLYDAAGDVTLSVTEANHCSVYELGADVFEWFCAVLGDGTYEPVSDHAVAAASELHFTPEGSVREAYPDERTIDDVIRASARDRRPDAGSTPTVDDAAAYRDRLRTRLEDRLGLDRPTPELYPRRVGHTTVDGLDVEYVFFKTERDPDVVCTGILVSDPDTSTQSPAVVLYETGTEAVADRQADVSALAADHGTVLVFDPRGVGAVRHRDIPIPTWVDDYYGIYGTEFKLAYDALLLGDSLFGMRVFDVLRGVEFLRGKTGCERVSVVGEGVGAYHALYAAVAADGVDAVELRELGPSFHELATSRRYDFDPRLTVFDVLDCDLPHCLAALDALDVPVNRTGRDAESGG